MLRLRGRLRRTEFVRRSLFSHCSHIIRLSHIVLPRIMHRQHPATKFGIGITFFPFCIMHTGPRQNDDGSLRLCFPAKVQAGSIHIEYSRRIRLEMISIACRVR